MNNKSTIASAGNTLAPALAAIKACGYTVSVKKEDGWLVAENESLRLISPDPLELLGLIRMRELRGDDWEPTDEEIDALLALESRVDGNIK